MAGRIKSDIQSFLENILLFAYGLIEFENLLNKSIWLRDDTLKSTNTPVQSEPGGNRNEEVI